MDYSKRGRPDDAIVGGPKEVADALEEEFEAHACDGFVIAATHVPGAYEDFVEYAVPELQRRGLFQREYRGATLRENLGLARPA
jgi:alkanesulfonate monooxygenase SsuD/methylene tetrahydromethanopterin reductase-like flavin-dependent oxidoreductase (luciferase family)